MTLFYFTWYCFIVRVKIKLCGAKERTEKLIERAQKNEQLNPCDAALKALADLKLLSTNLEVLPIRGDFGALVENITRGDLRFLYEEQYLSHAELAKLMGVPKAKIERWLKPGKSDDCILPYKCLDFCDVRDRAPQDGERWKKLIAHALASMGKNK